MFTAPIEGECLSWDSTSQRWTSAQRTWQADAPAAKPMVKLFGAAREWKGVWYGDRRIGLTRKVEMVAAYPA